MPDCISKDTVIRQPQAPLQFPEGDGAQETPPFVLKGGPMTGPPVSVRGLSMFRRKPGATRDTTNRQAYFAQDQYYEVRVASEHILSGDPNTTLRYDNRNYTLRFGCLHSQPWKGPNIENGLHFSLIFTTSDGAFFHICLPVSLTGTPENENFFLKYWLYNNPGAKLPNGFTVNEVLNTREQFSKYTTLQYCLLYNANKNLSVYTFCYFKTPLKINKSLCPSWLQNNPSFTQAQAFPNEGETFKTWRPQTFDENFNLMMRGTFRKMIFNEGDPYVTSDEAHFDLERTQAVVQPTFYRTKTLDLTGKLFAQPFQKLPSGIKGLKNVKCYPIDLASQIDDEGNIYVDESTNKPIDIAEASGRMGDAGLPSPGSLAEQKKQRDYFLFVGIFLIIVLILTAIAVVIIVVVFKGNKATEAVAEVAANLGNNGASANSGGSGLGGAGVGLHLVGKGANSR